MRTTLIFCAASSTGAFFTSTLAFAPVSTRSALARVVRRYDHRAPSSGRGADMLKMSDGSKEENFLASLIEKFTQKNQGLAMETMETEEEKQQRLQIERLAEIEAGEVRRQARVAEDKFGYLFLFALQLLPLIGSDRVESIIYFFGVAVCTVYLGGRQEVIDRPERVTRDNALYAPVGASLAIGGLYTLLKVGIDITSLYAAMVTIFGVLAISGKWSLSLSLLKINHPILEDSRPTSCRPHADDEQMLVCHLYAMLYQASTFLLRKYLYRRRWLKKWVWKIQPCPWMGL